jgi:hypothetical protein
MEGKSVGGSVAGIHDCPMVKHIKPDGHSRGVLRPASLIIKGQGMASRFWLHSSVAFCHPLPQNIFEGLGRLFLNSNSFRLGAGVGERVSFAMLGAIVIFVSLRAIVEFVSSESIDAANVALVSLYSARVGAIEGGNVSFKAMDGDNVSFPAPIGALVVFISIDGESVSFPAPIGALVAFISMEGANVSFPATMRELVVLVSLSPP